MACWVCVPELGYVFGDANRGKVVRIRRRWRDGGLRSKRRGVKPDVTTHRTRTPPEANKLLATWPEMSRTSDPKNQVVKGKRRVRSWRRRCGFVEAKAVEV